MIRPNEIIVDGARVTITTSRWSPVTTSVHVPDAAFPVGYIRMMTAGKWQGTSIVVGRTPETAFYTDDFWAAVRLLAEIHYNNRKVDK